MRLAILSRSRSLHSVRRLLQEARAQSVTCDVLNPLECQLIVAGKHSRIEFGNREVPHYNAVLPRIGTSITDYGLAVVKQFELRGMKVINPSRSIADSRDKLRCLQILSEIGLEVPPTVLARTNRGIKSAIEAVGGFPVVLKTLRGTQGVGVMLIPTPVALGSVLDTLRGLGEDVLIQRFIAEGAGSDYRAFVIGDKVIAAMMRTAPEGEFRSNIHRGGEGKLVKLPKSFERAAIRAAKRLGLQVAGIDLMQGKRGPLILEANSSPGFEGIERATGLNIASQIIKLMVRRGRGR